jgi:hypothetical protein
MSSPQTIRELPQIRRVYGHYHVWQASIMDELLRIPCMLSDKLIDRSNEERIALWIIKQPEEGRFRFACARRKSIDDKVMLIEGCNGIHLMLQWGRHNVAHLA